MSDEMFLALRETKFDYSGCCDQAKQIMIEGAMQDRIPIGEFIAHEVGCETCRPIVHAFIADVMQQLPAYMRFLGGIL